MKNLINTLFLFISILIVISTGNMLKAEEISKNNIEVYLEKYKNDSKTTAINFSKIVVQSNDGRMKPLNTLNRKILKKLSGKSSIFEMNADQIILGMLTQSEIWRNVKMIKIKTPKLKKILGVENSRKYISFSEVFKNGKYLLSNETKKISRLNPSKRGTYEKDVVKLDEKLSIAFMVYTGNIFKIFPQKGVKNNKWYSPIYSVNKFQKENKIEVQILINGLITSTTNNDWQKANHYINKIKEYQINVGSEVMLTYSQINNEIFFNKIDIFSKLTLAYLFLGLIMLIVAFVLVFNPNIKTKRITFIFFLLLGVLFIIHSFGMGYRWVVSGHAPWSNTYESLLYISWSAVFAGVIFFRKSLLALSAAVIVAAIFMFTAHLTSIDPQITNLVPVLKSYWLTIHVSILTASYGFFGLGAILGFITLILFIFRKNRPHIDESIKHITAINEISLIIGLSALTIGNFLGGVWANESWGRYWGWDPKETWAYISIIVYIIVIHLRFVKSLDTPFIFSLASLLSFSSILMTYFGVNFYLSGLHSYATGDPVVIPVWVFYTMGVLFVTIVLALENRNLKNKLRR